MSSFGLLSKKYGTDGEIVEPTKAEVSEIGLNAVSAINGGLLNLCINGSKQGCPTKS